MARQLTAFRLDEISGVDSPAQRKAKMLITKRDEEEPMTVTIEKARGNFVEKVSMIQKRDNISKLKAMERASIEFPAEHEAYSHGALAGDPDRTSGLRKSNEPTNELKKARGDFQTRVAEIKKRDGISTTRAMEKAAAEYPDEFAAYQAA